MQDTAVVGLAVGGATLLCTITAGLGAFIGERLRARGIERNERKRHQEQQREKYREDVKSAFAEVRYTVTKVSVGVQLVQRMRSSPEARLDPDDLSAQIRRNWADFPAAEAAIWGLWTVSRDETIRLAVEELLRTTAWAFEHGLSAGGEMVDPAKIEERVQDQFKRLSGAISAHESIIDAPH